MGLRGRPLRGPATGGGTEDYLKSVRVATTAALPANTRTGNVLIGDVNGPLPAIDGETLVLNDRLMVKNEALGANNGPSYDLTQVGVAGLGGSPFKLTRSSDADTSAEVTSGLRIPIAEGTTQGGEMWYLATSDVITINVTAQTYARETAAPGGSNTQVQFNDSGDLGGHSGFLYDKATGAVVVTGSLAVDNLLLNGSTLSNPTGGNSILLDDGGDFSLIGNNYTFAAIDGAGFAWSKVGNVGPVTHNLNAGAASYTQYRHNIGGFVRFTQGVDTSRWILEAHDAAGVLIDSPFIVLNAAGADIDLARPLDLNTNPVKGVSQLDVDNLRLDGNTASSTDVNGDFIITPNGTGDVVSGVVVAGLGAPVRSYTGGSGNVQNAVATSTEGAGGFASYGLWSPVTGVLTEQAVWYWDDNGNSANLITLANNADIIVTPHGTGGFTVNAATFSTTGNNVLGNAAADTLKTHGTAEAGTQAANVVAASQTSADTGAITAADVDTTAARLTDVQALQVDYDKMVVDMAAVVAKLNSALTCLKTHGLMATA